MKAMMIAISISIAALCLLIYCFAGMRTNHVYTKENLQESLKELQHYPDALYPVKIDGQWGYINRAGKMIIQPVYENAEDFSEGFAVVMKIVNMKRCYGYIDKNGQEITRFDFTRARPFVKEGLACISRENLYGYIDTTGKEVIPAQFEEAFNFSENLAAVRKDQLLGYIDRAGKWVIPPQFFHKASIFSEGMAAVYSGDKGGYIDHTGKFILPPIYYRVSSFSEGLAAVSIKTETEQGISIKTGFIDQHGKMLIEPVFDLAWDFFNGYTTGWYISDDKTQKIWKCVDKKGRVILDSLPYRNVGAYQGGLIGIQNNDMRWGFMDITGKEVIQPRFSGINLFHNGLARMEIGDPGKELTIVYINKKGEIVWQP